MEVFALFRYDRLNALAKETGVKKAHLCRLLGRSEYYLRDAEKNNTNISGRALSILAEALGTTPEYLTGESDEKKPLVNGDEELTEYLQALKEKPGLRMLFSLTKNATAEDVDQAVKIILALRGD